MREILNASGREYRITKRNFEGLIGLGLQSGSLVLKFDFLFGDFERNMIFHLITLSLEMGHSTCKRKSTCRDGDFQHCKVDQQQCLFTFHEKYERYSWGTGKLLRDKNLWYC